MIDLDGKIRSKRAWLKFSGTHIPSSLELDPVIYKYLKTNFKILDVGCGFGKTVFELEKLGYKNLFGIDMNPSGILYAKTKNKKLRKDLHFRIGNVNNLNFNNNTFDFLITQAFWTTTTNIIERLKIAKEINRILKVGGVIYIADFIRTWNHAHYRKVYLQGVNEGLELGTFKAYNKKTGKFMYLAHHFTKHEFFELLTKSGFCKPIYYKSTIFTTQSGNKIKGCVLISKKVI